LQKASNKGLEYLKAGKKNKAFTVLLKALTLDEDKTILENLGLLDL
jgi:hypothetical protein